MRFLYSLLHYLALPLILLHLAWRGFGNPAYWRRWEERFGYFKGHAAGHRAVWLHAVSVGEVQAALPLIRSLLTRYRQYVIVVTTTTATGRERVREALGDEVMHSYLPYDLPPAVRRFLDRVDPAIAIILETELWPNIFHQCRQRSIPVVLANLRLSQRSAEGYRRVGGLTREMLGNVSAIAAQSEDDAARLISLGADPTRVRVTGSIKFDVRLPGSLHEQAEAMRRAWGIERGVWVAASTHDGEDEQVLHAFTRILRVFPNCLLVVVPRHPERFSRVAALSRRRGYYTVLRSEGPRSCNDVDVYIGDTMGELPVFYAAADVAFVGGSLVRVGGHNVLEPAALGIPVIFGPHVFNFSDICRRLCEIGAASMVNDSEALGVEVARYLGDPKLRQRVGEKGRCFVEQNRGAGERTMELIAALLPAAGSAPGSVGSHAG